MRSADILRKFTVVITVLAYATVLVACGGGGNDSTPQTNDDNSNKANQTPIALNDVIALDEDTTIVLKNLLDNDSDADQDELEIIEIDIVTNKGSTITNNSDGTFTYTPLANFNGKDQFSYTVSDGNGGTAQADVLLNIAPVNDPPIAVGDIVSLIQDKTTNSQDIVSNDSDIDGDSLNILIEQSDKLSEQGGTITYQSDNTFKYVPTPGFIGEDRFFYTVADNAGATSRASVLVFVSGTKFRAQPSSLTDNMWFGLAVDANENFAVIGSPFEQNSRGAAYVFVRDQLNQWRQLARLTAGEDAVDGAQFGTSVAIYADTIVVGAPFESNLAGAVYFFVNEQGQWKNVKRLSAEADTKSDAQFGGSVAINKDFILVGAPFHTLSSPSASEESGAAFVFRVNNGDPVRGTILRPNDYDSVETEFSRFGQTVALSNNNLAIVGCEYWDGGIGSVYVYGHDAISGNWGGPDQLFSVDPRFDQFGSAVAIQHDHLFVGSPFGLRDISTGTEILRGKVEVFTKNSNGKWSFLQTLAAFSSDSIKFGSSVSVSNDLLLIGAEGSDSKEGAAGYLFVKGSDNQWTQQDIFMDDDEALNTSTVNITGRTAIIGAPLDDTGAADAGSVFIYQLPKNLQPKATPLRDPNQFLTLITSVQENAITATAYYQAIDPQNMRATLDDWKQVTGFGASLTPIVDAQAVYVNGADLGFGRRMLTRVNNDGSVASYVENYPSLQDAIDRTNILATVAMEYVAPSGNQNDKKYYTTFYVFGPDGRRLTSVDLDGRGEKYVPGLCNVCHGGQPLPLDDNGSYPNAGNTGSGFLPWDLDTYIFSDSNPSFSRENQEAQFKIFNKTVLKTNPTPAAIELIHGWYGGPNMPNGTFNGQYVPDGWIPGNTGGPTNNPNTSRDLYLKVVAPSCRACHIQRGFQFPNLDFSSYLKFMTFDRKIKRLVYDAGVMPLALKTFNNFWTDPEAAVLLEQHLSGIDYSTLAGTLQPGRPIADAGGYYKFFSSNGGPININLSGGASLFAIDYQWRFVGSPSNSTSALTGAQSKDINFLAVPGHYYIELTVNDGSNEDSDVAIVDIEGGVVGSTFSDVINIFNKKCTSCHNNNPPSVSGTTLNLKVTDDEGKVIIEKANELYNQLLDGSVLVNLESPDQSLILKKPAGKVSHGGNKIDGFEDDGPDYLTIKAWILEVSKNNN